MAVQLINIGNVANDGTGDDLREAFIKVNQNFEELDLRDDEQTTASNIGAEGEGLFFRRNAYDLEFKKISAGSNVTLTADDNKIVIATPDIGVTDLTITADNGTVVLDNSAALTISGGTDISTTIIDGILTVEYTGLSNLASDPSPQLSADLDAQSQNLLNVGTISSSGINGPLTGNVTGNVIGNLTGNVTGNVTGLVHGIDVREISQSQLDLGTLGGNITSGLDFFIATNDLDYGTIANNTSTIVSDFGSFS